MTMLHPADRIIVALDGMAPEQALVFAGEGHDDPVGGVSGKRQIQGERLIRIHPVAPVGPAGINAAAADSDRETIENRDQSSPIATDS